MIWLSDWICKPLLTINIALATQWINTDSIACVYSQWFNDPILNNTVVITALTNGYTWNKWISSLTNGMMHLIPLRRVAHLRLYWFSSMSEYGYPNGHTTSLHVPEPNIVNVLSCKHASKHTKLQQASQSNSCKVTATCIIIHLQAVRAMTARKWPQPQCGSCSWAMRVSLVWCFSVIVARTIVNRATTYMHMRTTTSKMAWTQTTNDQHQVSMTD